MDEFIREIHLEGQPAQSVKVDCYYMRLHQQKKGREHLASGGSSSPLCWVGPSEPAHLAW